MVRNAQKYDSIDLVSSAVSDVHVAWLDVYRTYENEKFFDNVFDRIVKILDAPPKSTILDVGCGDCDDAIRLARSGYSVKAIDYSREALKIARQRVRAAGYDRQISIEHGDATRLQVANNSYDYILCWGVLTTIPHIENAIEELSRILNPGGKLIISEHNMNSLQLIITRNIRKLLRKKNANSRATPAGLEVWRADGEGTTMTRQTNIKWLIKTFSKYGIRLEKRIPGQFTQAYARHFSVRGKRVIHQFNSFWFNFIKMPYLALDNILIFNKVDP